MKDQVTKLRQRGVAAVYISGTAKGEGLCDFEQAFSHNKYTMVFATPEALCIQSKILRLKAALAGRSLSLIAVDEAHCVSDWGTGFRSNYRNISLLRAAFPSTACIAVTATANERVQRDIISNLNLEISGGVGLVKASFDRPNIRIMVELKKEKTSEATARQVAAMQIASHIPDHGSAIVYCTSKKEVEDTAHDLAELLGQMVGIYHADVEMADRNSIQENWAQGVCRVMVATSAFGMGIDQANVRAVVHFGLPGSLTAYYQEMGRAGRDGHASTATLLWSKNDENRLRFIRKESPNPIFEQSEIELVVQFASTDKCKRTTLLFYFGEVLERGSTVVVGCSSCTSCLSELETLKDRTDDARILLQTVQCLDCQYGMEKTVLVLRGSKSAKVSDADRTCRTYGKGKGNDVPYWHHLWKSLIPKYIQITSRPGSPLHVVMPKLTSDAHAVLGGTQKVLVAIEEI
jgi:ATP-dependent DNA helicase RecQ